MFTKDDFRRAKPENVLRLARALRFRDVDKMSHRQLIRLLVWYYKRREKHARGLATQDW